MLLAANTFAGPIWGSGGGGLSSNTVQGIVNASLTNNTVNASSIFTPGTQIPESNSSNIVAEIVLTNIVVENAASMTFYPSNYISKIKTSNDLLRVYYRGLYTSRSDTPSDSTPINIQGGGGTAYSGESGGYSTVAWSKGARTNAWFFPAAATLHSSCLAPSLSGTIVFNNLFNSMPTKSVFGNGSAMDGSGYVVAVTSSGTCTNNPTLYPWIQVLPRFGTSFWGNFTISIIRQPN